MGKKKSNKTSQKGSKKGPLPQQKASTTDVFEALNINPQYFDPLYLADKALHFISDTFYVPPAQLWYEKELPYKSNPIPVTKYNGGHSNKKLAEGKYPYANTVPYLNKKAYDLRKIRTRPIIDYQLYEDLLNDNSGKVMRFDKVPYFLKTLLTDTAGGKNNNPCNISVPRAYAIGAIGTQRMAEGQPAGKFDTLINGIASTMRLYRESYGKRSFTLMNNGMLGFYDKNEPINLTALRLHYITNKCKELGIDPNTIIDTDDKWTLCSLVYSMAKSETGSILSRDVLEKAYEVAFGK